MIDVALLWHYYGGFAHVVSNAPHLLTLKTQSQFDDAGVDIFQRMGT